MSVEFLCPHCRAKMRTPDDAMGRETGCPACHGRLTVPTVEIPVEEPIATLVDDSSTAISSPAGVTFPEPQSTAELPAFVEPVAPADAFNFAEPTSVDVGGSTSGHDLSTRPAFQRRKKKSGWGVLAVITVVVAAGLGGMFALSGSGTGDLNGSIAGTAVDASSASASVALPPGVSTDRMIGELGASPVELKTDYFNTSFGAADGQLLVTVSKTDLASMIEVNLNNDPAAAKFLEQYSEALSSTRAAAVANSAAEMAVAVGKDPVDREAVVAYRDTVGMASLHAALGGNVVAEAGGFAHPVVSEPSPGVLRWFLPAGTTSFAISRNTANPGSLPPTFRYTVTVGQ